MSVPLTMDPLRTVGLQASWVTMDASVHVVLATSSATNHEYIESSTNVVDTILKIAKRGWRGVQGRTSKAFARYQIIKALRRLDPQGIQTEKDRSQELILRRSKGWTGSQVTISKPV